MKTRALMIALAILVCAGMGLGVMLGMEHHRAAGLEKDNETLRRRIEVLNRDIEQERKTLAELNTRLRELGRQAVDYESLATFTRLGSLAVGDPAPAADEDTGRRRPDRDVGERSERPDRGGRGGNPALATPAGRLLVGMGGGAMADRMVDRMYGRMFEKNGMTEEDKTRFKESLQARNAAMTDVAAAYAAATTAEERAAVMAHAKQVVAEADARMLETLGAEKYALYQTQNKMLPLSMTIAHITREAQRSGTALTDAQVESLHAAASQVAGNFQYSTDLSTTDKMIQNGVTDDSAKTFLDERKQMTDQFLSSIQGTVGSEQLAEIQNGQGMMDRFTQHALNSMKTLLSGEELAQTGGFFGGPGGRGGGGGGRGGRGGQGGTAQ